MFIELRKTLGLYADPNYDQMTGNMDLTLLTLNAESLSGNSPDFINTNCKSLQLGVNVTGLTGTAPTLIVSIQGKDVASGVYYTMLATSVIAATGFTQLTVSGDSATVANVSIRQPLPRIYRISYTIGGTTPAVTATVGGSIIL